MKKTQYIEIVNNIKHSLVSFVAITLFVALGVALFCGIDWSSKAFEKSIDADFDTFNFRDYEVAFPYGFDAKDIPEIAERLNASDVVGENSSCEFFTSNGVRNQAKIITITEKTDILSFVDGRLPEKENEIAVEKTWAVNNGISIGDTIVFEHNDDGKAHFLSKLANGDFDNLEKEDYESDGMKYLNCDTFTVTALAESPAYLCAFSVSYGASPTTSAPIECIMFASEKAFDNDAFCGYTELLITLNELEEYPFFSEEYEKTCKNLKDDVLLVTSEYADKKSQIIKEQFSKYTDGADVKLENTEKELLQRQQELKTSEKNLKNNKRTLTAAEYAEKESQLKTANSMLEDALKEYNDKKAQFVSAKNELGISKELGATVLTRQDNGGCSMAEMVTTVYSRAKYNLAIVFVVIGLLVCYFAVSRIVYKHEALIGTKKALGFTSKEITHSYLIYSGIAALLGIIIGLLVARFLLEPVLMGALKNCYLTQSTIYHFSILEALAISTAEFLLTILAAYLACKRILKRNAKDLLAGTRVYKNKEHFFENSLVWKKLPILSKTIINNFLADSRRVFSMLIGISGCTLLIVCAVSLKNCINGSFNKQYSKIQSFDTIVFFDKSNQEAKQKIAEVLDEKNVKYAAVHASMGALKAEEQKSIASFMFVFENDDTNGMINLYSMDKKQHSLEDKVWINCSYTNSTHLTTDNGVTYIDCNSQETSLPIDGIYEFYLQRCQVIMPESVYELQFGEKPEINAFLVEKGDVKLNDLISFVSGIDGYVHTDDFYSESKMAFNFVTDITDAILIVYITLSILMALLILLNLLVMFVEEKRKELITLMINGYSERHAKKYIYTDTIFLTVIGIIIGLVLGILMGIWNVNAMSTETSYFIHAIDWKACIIGVLMTSGITALMSVIALQRINRFNLSDLSND